MVYIYHEDCLADGRSFHRLCCNTCSCHCMSHPSGIHGRMDSQLIRSLKVEGKSLLSTQMTWQGIYSHLNKTFFSFHCAKPMNSGKEMFENEKEKSGRTNEFDFLENIKCTQIQFIFMISPFRYWIITTPIIFRKTKESYSSGNSIILPLIQRYTQLPHCTFESNCLLYLKSNTKKKGELIFAIYCIILRTFFWL